MSSDAQASAARLMYDKRAATYENSWHPDFAEAFVWRLPLFPGARVLDLACGTGLVTFLAAERVGSDGVVFGIDISPGMLAMARRKLEAGGAASGSITGAEEEEEERNPPDRWKHVRLFEHGIVDLDGLEELAGQKGTFDFITVASALVLLQEPEAAVRGWLPYLKPGGILAVDVPHPKNLIVGVVLERVSRRMGFPLPYHRGWVRDENSFPDLLRAVGGMEVLDNQFVCQVGYRERYLPEDRVEARRQFDATMTGGVGAELCQKYGPEWEEEARDLFCEEWLRESETSSDDGPCRGVKEVDGVWHTLARKPRGLVDDEGRAAAEAG